MHLLWSIAVVAAPTRTYRRVDFQRGIDDGDGINDDGIVGAANAVAHEFEETSVHDLLRGIGVGTSRRLICQNQRADIRIFAPVDVRIDSDVVPIDTGDERALGGDGPMVDVRFEKVRVVEDEGRGLGITGSGQEFGRTDKRGDLDRQRRR